MQTAFKSWDSPFLRPFPARRSSPELWTGPVSTSPNVTELTDGISFDGVDTGYIFANVSAPISSGDTYRMSWRIENYVSGNLNFQVKGIAAQTMVVNGVSGNGDYAFDVVATSDNTILEFFRSAGTIAVFDIMSPSIRKVL